MNFENLLRSYLEVPVFLEVLSLVKKNSRGKVWVMGGFVYKNIAAALYKIPPYEYDIDFIVEERNSDLIPVVGWEIRKNKYGNNNYVRDSNKMSFVDFRSVVRLSGRPETIEDFLRETPLNVQSIAYDIEGGITIGDIGKQALIDKVVSVNNLPQARYYADRIRKSVEEIVEEKASALRFRAIMPRTYD